MELRFHRPPNYDDKPDRKNNENGSGFHKKYGSFGSFKSLSEYIFSYNRLPGDPFYLFQPDVILPLTPPGFDDLNEDSNDSQMHSENSRNDSDDFKYRNPNESSLIDSEGRRFII